jgi:tetratricopeptide (TPR) repeat protein
VAVTIAAAVVAAEPAAAPAPETPAAGATEGPSDSLSPEVLVARAQLSALKQDWVQAERGYRDALERDAGRADAWRGFGYVLRKQNRPSEALDAYQKATALAPEDYDAWLGLGETYVALGRVSDAEKVLERLKEHDRRHAATLHHVITTKTPR